MKSSLDNNIGLSLLRRMRKKHELINHFQNEEIMLFKEKFGDIMLPQQLREHTCVIHFGSMGFTLWASYLL